MQGQQILAGMEERKLGTLKTVVETEYGHGSSLTERGRQGKDHEGFCKPLLKFPNFIRVLRANH